MLRFLLATVAAVGLSTAAQANDHEALLSMSWDEIVTQAQQEGSVNWFVWYFQPQYREIAEAFTAQYGIDVTIPEGTVQGNIDKMLAERNRAGGDIDVLAIPSDRIATFDHEQMLMGPLRATLPNGERMIDDLGGFEGHDYAWAYWGNQTGFAYDPEQVSGDELPQTLADMEAFWTNNPGRFGFNFENGGSGPSFIQNVARNVITDINYEDGEVTDEKLAALAPVWDWFLEYSDGYVITASNTDSLTRLSSGEFTIVPAWEDHLFNLQSQGEVDDTIEFYIPQWGMNGGGNTNVIPANAPNPAAALVFINWVSSAEVQTLFNETFGAAPMHPDADDSNALIPNEMRQFSRIWPSNPFGGEITNGFIENVALER